MKNQLPALLIALLLSSCNTYQMMIVKSNDTRQNPDNGSFFISNDSVEIKYTFSNLNGLVTISIINKLDHPLYIDWAKSSMVMNGKAYKYISGKVHFSGESSGYTFQNKGFSNGFSDFSGSAQLPQYIDFIPPKSFVKKQLITLFQKPISSVSKTAFWKIVVSPKTTGENAVAVNAKIADFDTSNSPLNFRSYLTFYTSDSTDRKSEFYYQNSFYISDFYKMNRDPRKTNLMEFQNQNDDRFYLSKTTGFAKGMIAVAAVGTLSTAAALDNSVNNKK